jgi:predicted transposase/invertase (TIGR01784 family)
LFLPKHLLLFCVKEDELETLQDKWIYFFKNWEKNQEIPAKMQEKELIEAYHAMEQFNWSKEELDAYIKANIALTDEYVARKQGREEEQKKIAKSMIKEGVPTLQISKFTGLTEGEIQAINRF